MLQLPPRPRAPIRLTRIGVELTPDTPWTLPPEPEVLLRGALGNAVFKSCCTRAHQHCRDCDLNETCPIPTAYDPGRVGADRPRPTLPRSLARPGARLAPDAPWRVQWTLLEQGLDPHLFLESLRWMARTGLGQDRVPHRVSRLWAHGEGPRRLLMVDDEPTGAPWPDPAPLCELLETPQGVDGALVRVVRPTRWKSARPDRWPTAADLLSTAIGRLRQVARAQGGALDAWWPDPAALDQGWQEARWVDASRVSSAGERHTLSGWVGTVELGPEVRPWVDVLAAAELLCIGQAVSFGRGQIRLKWNISNHFN